MLQCPSDNKTLCFQLSLAISIAIFSLSTIIYSLFLLFNGEIIFLSFPEDPGNIVFSLQSILTFCLIAMFVILFTLIGLLCRKKYYNGSFQYDFYLLVILAIFQILGSIYCLFLAYQSQFISSEDEKWWKQNHRSYLSAVRAFYILGWVAFFHLPLIGNMCYRYERYQLA